MDTTTILNVARVFWFNEDNASRSTGLYRDKADEHSLVNLLVGGWYDRETVCVRAMSKDEQAEAVKRLSRQWTALHNADVSEEPEKLKIGEKTVTVALSEVLKVFESLYVADGKIIPPEYKAATCFRRGNTLLKVNTVRAKNGQAPIDALPCLVRVYDKPMDQFVDNIRENQLKTAGARKMSSADEVGAARKLFQFGATESKIANAFGLKRGMAQKFHRLCLLDQAHPELEIIDRILAGKVDAKVFDKEKVKKLLDENASDEAVEAFIAAPNGGNDKKIMPKKEIATLEAQCPVGLIKLALQAVLKNDSTVLQVAIARAADINAAVDSVLNA